MDYNEKRNLILNGKMKKVILILAIPVMINNFIQTIYNLTDTYFVGKIGTTEIAAIQFVWPLIFLMMAFATGMGVAATALISQNIGAGYKEKAKAITGQIIILSGFISIICAFLGYFLSSTIISVLGATGSLYKNSVEFIKIMFLGMPTMFAMITYSSIKAGYGDNIKPMIYGGISVFINIILDPIFIFTFRLGIGGAAIATVLSRGIIGFYSIFTLFKKSSIESIDISHIKPNFNILQKIFSIGFPSSIGQSTSAIGFALMNVFIISLGESTLTAFSIGNKIVGLIMMPAMGIGSSLSAIIGQNLGAENIIRAKSAVKSSVFLSTIFLTIGGIGLLVFSNKVISFFSTDPEVLKLGSSYLIIITLGMPLMGLFQILIGTFQGSGHSKYAMYMMLGRLWCIRIPMLYIMKNFTNFQPSSVWFAMISSNFMICAFGLFMYYNSNWTESRIEKLKPEIVKI